MGINKIIFNRFQFNLPLLQYRYLNIKGDFPFAFSEYCQNTNKYENKLVVKC